MADPAAPTKDRKFIERAFVKAVREGKYAVVLNIFRKPRWKWNGQVLPEGSPKFVVHVEVQDFKLPSSEVPGAIFKLSRTVVFTGPDDRTEFKGVASPMDYLTLPAQNPDVPLPTLAQEFLAASVVRAFDARKDADAWVLQLGTDVQRFLKELYEFRTRNADAMASEGRETCLLTFNQRESVS